MKSLLFTLLFFCVSDWALAQQTINLNPGPAHLGPAPSVDTLAEAKLVFIRNVTNPTLTVYKSAHPSGTAVIVCPGGAFRLLSVTNEGLEVAEWLNAKGVTVFILNYRLTPTPVWPDPVLMADMQNLNFAHIDSVNAPYVPLAVADGREAIRYVREHAADFGILPNRIGIMGFSAGGTLAASVAQTYDAGSRPDFVAPIYAYTGAILGEGAPKDAPPMFLAMASDDPIAYGNLDLYKKWRDAGHAAELHIYAKGGHGFGARKQYLASDDWMNRFSDWLEVQGLLMTPERALSMAQYTPQQLAMGKEASQKRINTDWAYMQRFKEENQKLVPPKPGVKRVVFMGDSITEAWEPSAPDFFADKSYVARGISGQTTPQMLLRFRQDVLDLKPAVVHILAGTNDIAENTGPISIPEIMGNIAAMAELAKAHHIEVVLSAVLPALEYSWKPGMQPAEKIERLNVLIKDYAANNDCIYLDYYTPMVDQRKGLQLIYSEDGVHPNKEGYEVMGALAEKAIAAALKKQKQNKNKP